MRRLPLIIIVFFLGACQTSGRADADSATIIEATLSGEWIVDLSANPDEPYTKPMVLVLNEDGTVSGSFYETAIEEGRWRTDRGRTCASFRTRDGSGPYQTAACLDGNIVKGQTWSEGRDFLFNWEATRG